MNSSGRFQPDLIPCYHPFQISSGRKTFELSFIARTVSTFWSEQAALIRVAIAAATGAEAEVPMNISNPSPAQTSTDTAKRGAERRKDGRCQISPRASISKWVRRQQPEGHVETPTLRLRVPKRPCHCEAREEQRVRLSGQAYYAVEYHEKCLLIHLLMNKVREI